MATVRGGHPAGATGVLISSKLISSGEERLAE